MRLPLSRKVVVGLCLVAFFVLLSLIGPLFMHTDPQATGPDVLQAPSCRHLLGTTQTGEDVLAQLINGGRVSLGVGALAACVATVLSVTIGLISGYARGAVDGVLSIITSVFLVIPALPLLIVLAGYLPNKGIESVAIVISVTAWASGARVIRAQTLSVRRRDYIEAARASGERGHRIIFAEILPNEITLIAASFLSSVVVGILAEAGLSFLGLGSLTTVSWGSMLYYAQNAQALLAGAWWWFIPPGLAIALVGTGLALINFGIDEYANPRLRGIRRKMPPSPPTPAAAAEVAGDAVLSIRGLSVDYLTDADPVHAVADVDLTLHRGEMLGIAGESGSGKSTLANAVARLLRPPAMVTAGSVRYQPRSGADPVDVLGLDSAALRAFRWADLAIVFQSAMNSLNPVLTIGAQFDDVLRAHRRDMSAIDRRKRAATLLERVGIPGERLRSYPHELSGGMRQRAAIAIALVLDPDVIIMDEPTTALDVVVQREILQEILQLRQDYGFAVIFITHDLTLLLEICDTIAIMYGGRVVESGTAAELHAGPMHPYTRGLLDSAPRLRGDLRALHDIPGAPPDLSALPAGCAFHDRCSYAFDSCVDTAPPLLDRSGRRVACLLHDSALRPEPVPEPVRGRP